jgi:hypothetical protein
MDATPGQKDRKSRMNDVKNTTFISVCRPHNRIQQNVLTNIPADFESLEVNAMSEIVFLTIAASAAVFKAAAIVIGVIWAFRSLLTQHAAPFVYRHTRAEIPYLSGIARK